MRFIGIVLLALSLVSCVSKEFVEDSYNKPGWYGYIEEDTSGFDGVRSLKLIPTYLNADDPSLLLGARWNQKFPKETLALIVDVSDALNFEPSEPLQFRIDDEYLSLQPLNTADYGDKGERYVGDGTSVFSNPVVRVGLKTTKEYWISRAELDSLLAAQIVFMRAPLINAKYLEGEVEAFLGGDERMEFVTAKQAIKRFISRVDAVN